MQVASKKYNFTKEDIIFCESLKNNLICFNEINNTILGDLVKYYQKIYNFNLKNETKIIIENRKIKATIKPNKSLDIHKDSNSYADFKCNTIVIYYNIDNSIRDKDLEIHKDYKLLSFNFLTPFKRKKVSIPSEIIEVLTGQTVFIPEGVPHKPQNYYSLIKDQKRYVLNLFIKCD